MAWAERNLMPRITSTCMTLRAGYNPVQGGGKNDGWNITLMCATLLSNELHCTTCFASRNIYFMSFFLFFLQQNIIVW